jgi:hypothetical protein
MNIMGETSMHRAGFALSGFAITALIAMSGCDPQPSSERSGAAPATVASVPAPAPPATADPATAKACKDLKKDIKDNAAKIAKAEKIGPPAGHFAVSAQWAAGSTAVIAHSIGADEAVSAAADAVQQEMMALGDKYNKSADARPSTKKLKAAVEKLTAACSAA